MKTLLLLACALAAQAQETSKALYAHVDFVDVVSGKASEYHKALKDLALPKLEERIKSGDEYAFADQRI